MYAHLSIRFQAKSEQKIPAFSQPPPLMLAYCSTIGHRLTLSSSPDMDLKSHALRCHWISHLWTDKRYNTLSVLEVALCGDGYSLN
ncbi:hypothetical protein AVEN_19620-1 [Araneus ventricosus]|uniref:Uncharacterized protein n=1 Tax=Araneus ventricosus TaxID=182803 RepID=A0A4Y2MWT4_ARAVE|nr:hypothetical protein AVEN_19620-1 [Araneus ventricosus]